MNTTCVTSQNVGSDITAGKPISVRYCWSWRLLKQVSNKLCESSPQW